MDSPACNCGTPYKLQMKSAKITKTKPKKKSAPPTSIPRARPRVVQTGEVMTIRHHEYVGPLVPSANNTYATTTISTLTPGYDLTPSNGVLFPWLSRLAQGFELFKINSIKIKLVSYQPSTATGAVYVAADPDWQDDVPVVKQTLLGLSASSSHAVWETFEMALPVSRFQGSMPWRYLAASTTRSSGEPRTSNYGFLAFGTDCADTYRWDIFVEYVVELKQPTIESLFSSQISDKSSTTTSLIADSAGNLYPRMVLAGTKTPNQVGINLSTSLAQNLNAPIAVPIAQFTKQFSHDTEITPTGASPLDLMAAGIRPGMAFYDEKGALVVTAQGDADGYVASTGVNDPSKIDVDDQPLHMVADAVISRLKITYPSIAYLIPFISGAVAAGSYTTSHVAYRS